MNATRSLRSIPLAWGIAAFLALAALSRGPGISREEAGVLAAAGAVPAGAAVPAGRPPLPAMLSRAGEAATVRFGLSHLAGYRLGSALAAGLLAALVAMLAGELAGPAAAALAPALLLAPPRLLLPLLQAGPRAAGAALTLCALLAYRRAAAASHRRARLAAALACGALFGLALAFQLESSQLLAVVAAQAVLVPALLALRAGKEPEPEPEPRTKGWDIRGPTPPTSQPIPEPGDPPAPVHGLRSSLLAVAAMVALGPAIALALWPWLWTDTLHRAGAALASAAVQAPVLHLGRLVEAARPPPGYPVVVTALALPASLVAAFAAGWLYTLWRLWRAVRGLRQARSARDRAGLPDELLLLLAAAGPFAAAQLGLSARAPGPGPWLAAFPVLAALAARAILACAGALWPRRAHLASACLAAAVLAPAVAASVHAYPHLGSTWGELAGGAPGAATLGLARHDGEAVVSLLGEISDRARPGARVHWGSIPEAALAVYVADGRLRPDLVRVASPGEADLALVPVAGRPRDEEYRVWAALRTSTPAAGAFLDEVPLVWVYARPGAWR
jgi:hypothetical protein